MARLSAFKATPAMLLGAVLSVTSIALAAGHRSDPVVGTWKLNAARSKFISGPTLRSDQRIYEESSDGRMKVTLRSITGDGKETTLTRTFRQDGKDYPVNDSSGVDSISETRVDDLTATYVEKKAGKAMLTGRRVLSKDGKILTVSEAGADGAGGRIRRTLVYDRQ